MTKTSSGLSLSFLYLLLMVEGFVLMGFEMLASRYMNPYFGGSIQTWACIISVVLCAMAAGYFIGGYISSTRFRNMALITATAVSGLYLVALSFAAPPILLWVIQNYEVAFATTFLASMGLLFVPVLLLSFWAPTVISISFDTFSAAGRVAGMVYSLSTFGNVVGTLVTAFLLVPSFGSAVISRGFGVTLLFIAFVLYLMLRRKPVTLTPAVGLAALLLPWGTNDSSAGPIAAKYPEGVFIESPDRFYFAQMTADQVTVVEQGKARPFLLVPGCGPTGVTAMNGDTLLIACHRNASILVVNKSGKRLRQLLTSQDGTSFRNPNDINSDGQGGAFFSDPGPFHLRAGAVGRVYHIQPDFTVALALSELRYPNGVAFDNNRLLVSEHLNRRVLSAKVSPDKGTYGQIEIFHDFGRDMETMDADDMAGPDGLRVAADGRIAIALYGTGKLALLGTCGAVEYLSGLPKFVTSVGFADTGLIVAGAFNNSDFPYIGEVTAVDSFAKTSC